MLYNKNLITKRIEELKKEIQKIDKQILKETAGFQEGTISPNRLDKIEKLSRERSVYQNTQNEFYAIIGQWKEEESQ